MYTFVNKQTYKQNKQQTNSTQIPNSLFLFLLHSVADFLPPEYASLKGIEEKVLRERETLIGYTREQVEQLYVNGATSLPTHNTAFFPCKVRPVSMSDDHHTYTYCSY